jgi:sec-independent protein translocase protein TatA
MFGLGGSELAIIAIIVLLIFGARRLPEIGKGLGGAVREFRNIKKEIKGKEPEAADKEPKKEAASSIEGKIAEKVIQQVPGLKTAAKLKDKAEQVSKIL